MLCACVRGVSAPGRRYCVANCNASIRSTVSIRRSGQLMLCQLLCIPFLTHLKSTLKLLQLVYFKKYT